MGFIYLFIYSFLVVILFLVKNHPADHHKQFWLQEPIFLKIPLKNNVGKKKVINPRKNIFMLNNKHKPNKLHKIYKEVLSYCIIINWSKQALFSKKINVLTSIINTWLTFSFHLDFSHSLFHTFTWYHTLFQDQRLQPLLSEFLIYQVIDRASFVSKTTLAFCYEIVFFKEPGQSHMNYAFHSLANIAC